MRGTQKREKASLAFGEPDIDEVLRRRLLAEKLGLDPNSSADKIMAALMGETLEESERGNQIAKEVQEEIKRRRKTSAGGATFTTFLNK